MADTRIVINVYGGAVQDVFSSQRGVEIAVVDWDADGIDPSAETVKVLCSDGERRRAVVTCRAPHPLQDLAGTDAAAALQNAGIGVGPKQRSRRDDTGVFALYDLDHGELVSTAVFCSYSEAADEIDPRQTSVTVVRLVPD